MGTGASIYVPEWQVNDAVSARFRFANDETRSRLKQRLLENDYSLLLEAGTANPELSAAITSLIGNRYDEERFDTTIDQVRMDDGVFVVNKHQLRVEFLVSTVSRMRKQEHLQLLLCCFANPCSREQCPCSVLVTVDSAGYFIQQKLDHWVGEGAW